VLSAGEPGHLAHVADDGASDDRADAEEPGQAGAGGFDRRGQLLVGLAQLGIEAADVGEELGGQLAAGLGNSVRGGGLLQDSGSLSCRDLLRMTAGDQAAAPRAAGRRPGYGPGPGPGAVSPRSSAPRHDPRRAPGAGLGTAAPRPPPRRRHPGHSCSCPRPAAAAPGRPASAAHRPPAHRRRPAAGPAGTPDRRRPRSPRPAPATPPPTPAAVLPGTGRRAPAARPAAPHLYRSPPRCASSCAGRSRSSLPPSAHSRPFAPNRKPRRACLITVLALAPLSSHATARPGRLAPRYQARPPA
jgi:hypothetical protein